MRIVDVCLLVYDALYLSIQKPSESYISDGFSLTLLSCLGTTLTNKKVRSKNAVNFDRTLPSGCDQCITQINPVMPRY